MTRSSKVSLAALAAILIACATGIVPAWAAPFGAPHPATATSSSRLIGWIFAEQAAFYRSLSGFIRASKEDGAAMWELFGISFVYGIFHAVGPGHGKAVISSYVVANEETWRRGVVLSFASALLQALVAVAIVGVAAALRHSKSEVCVVLPTDMPYVTARLLQVLARAAAAVEAAVPQAGPLPAAFKRSCLPVLERRIAADELALRDAVAELEHRVVHASPDELRNVNTPSDLHDDSLGDHG
jgi:molybdopterin-guanine dinucleotide biosynthesis protein A